MSALEAARIHAVGSDADEPGRDRSWLDESVARWARLFAGLWVFGTGIALMVRADLGVSSWDVLHDALRRQTPLSFGARS